MIIVIAKKKSCYTKHKELTHFHVPELTLVNRISPAGKLAVKAVFMSENIIVFNRRTCLASGDREQSGAKVGGEGK